MKVDSCSGQVTSVLRAPLLTSQLHVCIISPPPQSHDTLDIQ